MTDSSATTDAAITDSPGSCPAITDSPPIDSGNPDVNWVRCDQEFCLCDPMECDGDFGWHRVLDYWEDKCENCEEYGCAYHYMHVSDCSCYIEDWLPERLVTWL